MLFANVCKNCRAAQPVVDGAQCKRCGDNTQLKDLLTAFTEQGRELQEARDELAQREEGAP